MKQTKIKEVEISKSTISRLKLEAQPDGHTIVHCNYVSKHKYINGGWVNIFPTTYLFHEGIYLQLQHAEQIPVAPQKHYFLSPGTIKTFTLFFPIVPKAWTKFDLIEKTNTGDGFIYRDITRNESGVYNISIS